ncbi:MAG: sugar nucleotide-binding protein, partial [Holosporaceae bacterium]|nr:sugar nucleotide-binding protein [Holosporaceae bacterium]
ERVFRKEEIDVVALGRSRVDAESCSVAEIQASIAGCDWVVNCIGIIKPYIDYRDSSSVQRAIRVNALFPHRLAEAAKNVGARVIQIATDCVFDGQIGHYTETSEHNATDVYGKTKSLGEVVAENFINLRCSIIGLELKNKTSLLEWFLNQPKGATINGFKNHLWNGVTTTAFARICVGIIRNNLQIDHMQHIIPANIVNKLDLLNIFKEIFNRNDVIVRDVYTDVGIDRVLSTNDCGINRSIWNAAKYGQIPTVEEMCCETAK